MEKYKRIIEAFKSEDPNVDNIWRSIIIFGKNSASYKFSLAKSLLQLAQKNQTTRTCQPLLSIINTGVLLLLPLLFKVAAINLNIVRNSRELRPVLFKLT